MVLATAVSESLWVWIPITPSKRRRTSETISTRRPVRVPPLVSHRQSTSAPASGRGFERAQREIRVGDVAVEEMLGVVDHFAAVLLQPSHRLADQLEVLLFGDAQGAACVQVPALAEDGYGRRIGCDERLHVAILGRRGSWRSAWSRTPSAARS